MAEQQVATDSIDQAVEQGGAYEVIRKRLTVQGKALETKTQALNSARLVEFGGTDMSVTARVRVRTENNCIARDIVQVGDNLLFGYNVFIGLKKETKIEDVFALFTVIGEGEQAKLEPVDISKSFLADASFRSDFDELYRYYKNTRLMQLSIKDGKLLAGFQIGERLEDTRVFRWGLSADGKQVTYIDNRGERDIQLPPAYDFEWVETGREDVVNGRHPHVNILDTVFVETIGGNLTVKIENNTEDGDGVFAESVDDDTQSIDDAQILYADVGGLILLSIKPYRETETRYLLFNKLAKQVLRVDEIGESCVQLPEDHGIIFPGGYYLKTGAYKKFDDGVDGLKFKRSIRSPNGEDMLFVFYEPETGTIALFAYNLINKTLANPIVGHGYALAEDGSLIIFSAESEPTRVHPMQLWVTPYFTQEFASKIPENQSFYGKIGNAELVRGVSDLFSICRLINEQSASAKVYDELRMTTLKIFDDHYWVADEQVGNIDDELHQIAETAELVIDEFEKVQSISEQSVKALADAEKAHATLLASIQPDSWQTTEQYTEALDQLRHQRGHLATIKAYRYINVTRVEELEETLIDAEAKLGQSTVEFLATDNSLKPYTEKLKGLTADVDKAKTRAELTPAIEAVEHTAVGLDLLSELMAALKIDDATVRTRIIDNISEIYAKLNQIKANALHKRKNLGADEAVAQFSAQFKLFSQSIVNALGLSDTPENCDQQLSRLLMQLEELEAQFSDFDQFLGDIMDKREEVYQAFESHKQQLLDERQRKSDAVATAATRVLSSIEKRSLKFTEADELNTYFAADAMVLKVRELATQLRDLDHAVKADDIDSRFKGIKEQALRSLRDKSDIFEEGGNVIKLGPRHKFSVNNQPLDLTIIPRQDELMLHLTGTDYYESIENDELNALNEYWQITLESETDDIYRAEYLAALILSSAQAQENELSMAGLLSAVGDEDMLSKLVRDFAAPRYKESYEKGIHDHDAALILKQLIPAIQKADLLRYDPLARGFAQTFWANINLIAGVKTTTWQQRAASALQMQSLYAKQKARDLLALDIDRGMHVFLEQYPFVINKQTRTRAAEYLVSELGRERCAFITSQYAVTLVEEFKRSMDKKAFKQFETTLEQMESEPNARWELVEAWLSVMVEEKNLGSLQRYIPEAIPMLNHDQGISQRKLDVQLELSITDLMGGHQRLQNRTLSIAVDEFLQRFDDHRSVVIPGYRRYLETRQTIMEEQRDQLRLQSYQARPLSSFVRNQLINEAYLPVIGDNLAKQIGTVGEDKRSDLMGLLMMISPPGYGKTTLMEYVANRLGLIFMKINCPSLGHDVVSLDPAQAPNATAKQELEKINLAFEMGNNVMLYLDDIQHTHPEFLQKYISLCDGTRRIDGVWRGKTKTYDMRGKKFCVVMAGNPYTESGETFKIPDMLANRADIYNLGDILSGMDDVFALSYIENSLTSNAVLAPLATRDMADVYKLVGLARGKEVATSDLSHSYSGAEINEISGVFQKLFIIQDVVLKINQQYIAAAAQDDKYRTEPTFKLQGSYRNMNKMAEKVSAVMNEKELMQMIDDHYQGEAQLLTQGVEANLLKLAELRGNMTTEQTARWDMIKSDFSRNQAMGGDESDAGTKMVGQLLDISGHLELLQKTVLAAARQPKADNKDAEIIQKSLLQLSDVLAKQETSVQVVNQPVPGMDSVLTVLADTIEKSIVPLVINMHKKLDIDLNTLHGITGVSDQIKDLQKQLKHKK